MPNAVARVSIGDSIQSKNRVEMACEVFNLAMVVDTAAQRWGVRVVFHHYETGRAVTYRKAAKMMNRIKERAVWVRHLD